MSDSVRPHRRQPTRPHRPWDSPGKNTGVGCHFLLQCMKVKSESDIAQSCPTLSDPMDCSLPGSSVHGIFQARVLEWGASRVYICHFAVCFLYVLYILFCLSIPPLLLSFMLIGYFCVELNWCVLMSRIPQTTQNSLGIRIHYVYDLLQQNNMKHNHQGAWAKVWRKSDTGFQESSSGRTAQDTLNSSIYRWNNVCKV